MGDNYYSLELKEIYKEFNSSTKGLTSKEAKLRLEKYGLNQLPQKNKRGFFTIFLSQFKSPLILILIFASFLSYFLGEITESLIILAIILMNSLISFYQEYKSERSLNALLKYISFNAKVLRDGKKDEIPVKEIVKGDIIYLELGDIVPADIRIIQSQDLYADQSSLTGESNWVEKDLNLLISQNLSLNQQKNMLFMGSVITGGHAIGIVVATAKNTQFGKTAFLLNIKEPPGNFQKGLNNFSSFLVKIIFGLTSLVFIINYLLNKGTLDSFLFAIALAVGITPELLPIIITISLSTSALHLARKKVIVKKLVSIEDLGNIDVLCTDKTGTLTQNSIILNDYMDLKSEKNQDILIYSSICNSALLHGNKAIGNTIDSSILQYVYDNKIQVPKYDKIDYLEFDHTRRRMSVVINLKSKNLLISKGSPSSIFQNSSKIKLNNKTFPIKSYLNKLNNKYQELAQKGYRVIALSYKEVKLKKEYNVDDEKELIFLGFLIFYDPPKEHLRESLEKIKNLGVELKVITGDNEFVTKHICDQVGIKIKNKIILGDSLDKLNEEQFSKLVEKNNIFAKITPQQKYKIVMALSKNNHVVGFLGDGVNDAPALKIADVGISVDSAVDVAKESCDVILMKKNLMVIADGISQGRKTFGNTTKYILNTISANFGNMITLSISSIYFKFIPLLPSQILLVNFISDVPMSTISTDNVDASYSKRPKKWNINFITKFMIFFGIISTIFDIITMLILWFFLAPGDPKLFRTAWYVESILTEIIIVFSIRTREVFWKSSPSRLLILSSLFGILLVLLTLMINPIASLFEFAPLSPIILFSLGVILISYFVLVELAKVIFYKYVSE